MKKIHEMVLNIAQSQLYEARSEKNILKLLAYSSFAKSEIFDEFKNIKEKAILIFCNFGF
jgi:hypothetical protein